MQKKQQTKSLVVSKPLTNSSQNQQLASLVNQVSQMRSQTIAGLKSEIGQLKQQLRAQENNTQVALNAATVLAAAMQHMFADALTLRQTLFLNAADGFFDSTNWLGQEVAGITDSESPITASRLFDIWSLRAAQELSRIGPVGASTGEPVALSSMLVHDEAGFGFAKKSELALRLEAAIAATKESSTRQLELLLSAQARRKAKAEAEKSASPSVPTVAKTDPSTTSKEATGESPKTP